MTNQTQVCITSKSWSLATLSHSLENDIRVPVIRPRTIETTSVIPRAKRRRFYRQKWALICYQVVATKLDWPESVPLQQQCEDLPSELGQDQSFLELAHISGIPSNIIVSLLRSLSMVNIQHSSVLNAPASGYPKETFQQLKVPYSSKFKG